MAVWSLRFLLRLSHRCCDWIIYAYWCGWFPVASTVAKHFQRTCSLILQRFSEPSNDLSYICICSCSLICWPKGLKNRIRKNDYLHAQTKFAFQKLFFNFITLEVLNILLTPLTNYVKWMQISVVKSLTFFYIFIQRDRVCERFLNSSTRFPVISFSSQCEVRWKRK